MEEPHGIRWLWEQRQELVMADMRLIAVCVEEYSIDHGSYPKSDGHVVNATVLHDRLEPTYVAELPRLDPWGAPYLYWSDGKTYFLIATGKDVKEDHPYTKTLQGTRPSDSVCGGATGNVERDLVFIDGQFCQWFTRQ